MGRRDTVRGVRFEQMVANWLLGKGYKPETSKKETYGEFDIVAKKRRARTYEVGRLFKKTWTEYYTHYIVVECKSTKTITAGMAAKFMGKFSTFERRLKKKARGQIRLEGYFVIDDRVAPGFPSNVKEIVKGQRKVKLFKGHGKTFKRVQAN